VEIVKSELHPEAVRDFYNQLRYLEEKQCSLLTIQKFVHAIREGRDKIERNPITWNLARGSKRVRKLQVPAFRYVIYYLVQSNGVPLILEFAGPGQQPRWWKRL